MSHNRKNPSSSMVDRDVEESELPVKGSSVAGDNDRIKSKKQEQLLNKTFLSKNALYTPMAGYDQGDVDPNQYLATKSSIPKSVQESSLVQFYRNVSLDYHYKNPKIPSTSNMNGNDYKYAGASRPIPLADVNDRIRQRTVTLLGGGIHTVATMSSSVPSEPSILTPSGHLNSPESTSLFAAANTTGTGSLKQRRRRRKRRRGLLKGNNEEQTSSRKWQFAAINNTNQATKIETSPITSYQLDFLRQLNSKWTDYMLQVLQMMPTGLNNKCETKKRVVNNEYKDDDGIANSLSQRIQLLSSHYSIELVGAHVRILSCPQNLSLVNKTGVVVSHSRNCWTIAMIQVGSAKKKMQNSPKCLKAEGVAGHTQPRHPTAPLTPIGQSKLHVGQGSHASKHTTSKQPIADQVLRSVLVPKRGSSIGILLSFPSPETSETTNPSTADLNSEKDST